MKLGEKMIRFKYPEAVLAKHLILPEFAYKRALKDIEKSEKG